MRQNLTPDDPEAFLDYPAKDRAAWMVDYRPCPKCKGHGGWNLNVNVYKNHYEDTPENRHRFSHFRCTCDTCNGWGWISPKQTCTDHNWVHVANLGRCYNRYKCTKCGAIDDVDSGD